MEHHLAQVNIAKMRAALDDPIMSGFTTAIDKINSLAESSAGFIWRYEYSVADAALLLPYDRENIVFNLSVWDSLDALKRFVYDSTHSEYIKSKLVYQA